MDKWWLEKPERLIQTNLREIDVNFDLETYLKSLQAFSASAIIFNTGGIVANYPTKLDYHYLNPYLQNNLVGQVCSMVQKQGIKFIARFDFSKVNDCYSKEKPDWLYQSPKGKNIVYNGQVHVCVNSYYQQEYSLQILAEVIEQFPIDGVFFNMSGYVTYDYSGNDHGICQCDNCKQAFLSWSKGLELPQKEDKENPVYRAYVRFQHESTEKLFQKIANFVKSKNPQIAICNYGLDSGYFAGTDILRNESNTALSRPLPEWNYSASDHIKKISASAKEVAVSNSAVHFIDYPYRHVGVSPHLTALRIAENIANCAWLDYYVIGHLDNQYDRTCFLQVQELFAFHKKHENLWKGLTSKADVALVIPETCAYYGSLKEYQGLFRMLSQFHILFDVIRDSSLIDLEKYQMVILPDVRNISQSASAYLDEYVAQGGKLFLTGASGTCDEVGNPRGRFGMEAVGLSECEIEVPFDLQGKYFRLNWPKEQKQTEESLLNTLDLLPLLGEFWPLLKRSAIVKSGQQEAIEKQGVAYLPLLLDVMYGPPEKCYFTEESQYFGLWENHYGQGKCFYLPWHLGKQYERLGNHSHLYFLSVLLERNLQKTIVVKDSPLVEVFLWQGDQGEYDFINLVNHSGQSGNAFLGRLSCGPIQISYRTKKRPKRIRALWAGIDLDFSMCSQTEVTGEDVWVQFCLPSLELLECLKISYTK